MKAIRLIAIMIILLKHCNQCRLAKIVGGQSVYKCIAIAAELQILASNNLQTMHCLSYRNIGQYNIAVILLLGHNA